MIPEAEDLARNLPAHMKRTLDYVYKMLVEKYECFPDVKTINLTFTRGEDLVASAHIGSNYLELALALPEDHPSPLLEDASHLTWRTLPVMVDITKKTNPKQVLHLTKEAAERIVNGEHDINRSIEYFAKKRIKTSWNQ